MKTVMKLIVVLGIAVSLMGCDESWNNKPEMEAHWNKEASAYFNQHVRPVKVMDGRKFRIEVIDLGDYGAGVRIFVDGEKRFNGEADHAYNYPQVMKQGIGGSLNSIIEWSPETGYLVQTGTTTHGKPMNNVSTLVELINAVGAKDPDVPGRVFFDHSKGSRYNYD